MVRKWTPPCFIDVPYAQKQNGVSDCGLFVIVFAVHLALGDDAVGLNFDQSKMRELKCFQRMPSPWTKAGPCYQTYFPIWRLNCSALVETGTISSVSVYSNFQQKGNNGTVVNDSSDCCIALLHKGAITEVIDLNAREFLHGDAKFCRKFCMEMPNPVGNFAWGCQIL